MFSISFGDFGAPCDFMWFPFLFIVFFACFCLISGCTSGEVELSHPSGIMWQPFAFSADM